MFQFTSFVWGCRHAGLNGQRVSNAVSQIHRSFSLKSWKTSFNILNYSDDYAGAEQFHAAATESFTALSFILSELGLTEAEDKAVAPTTELIYLGVQFDTVKMLMRIDADKCAELKSELSSWCRRTVATKQELQSILGKLMWISRAVKFSRAFINRIIGEIKRLDSQKQKATLSSDVRKDFVWWFSFMQMFNGVELIISDNISFNLAGDACPQGLGSWNLEKAEYFSGMFPLHLQDPQLPIHVKEFWCVIVSVKIWGSSWSGKRVKIYCMI